jgi:hypothetical protein
MEAVWRSGAVAEADLGNDGIRAKRRPDRPDAEKVNRVRYELWKIPYKLD